MSRTTFRQFPLLVIASVALSVAAPAAAQDTAAPPTPAPKAPAPKAQAPKAPAPKGPAPKAQAPDSEASAEEAKDAERAAPDEPAAGGDTPTGGPSYVETVPASDAAAESPPPARTRRPRRAPPAQQVYPAVPPPAYGGPSWPAAPPPPPRTERNSTGMMAAGIVLTSIGGLGLVGAGVLISQNNQENERCSQQCVPNERKRNMGIAIGVGGLAALGAGIPLLVIGARKVPAAVEEPAMGLTLELGPSGAQLTGSF